MEKPFTREQPLPPIQGALLARYATARMAPSAAPLCTVGSGALRIIPNLKKHSINFPHQTDTDGIFVQTKTVKTVVLVEWLSHNRADGDGGGQSGGSKRRGRFRRLPGHTESGFRP